MNIKFILFKDLHHGEPCPNQEGLRRLLRTWRQLPWEFKRRERMGMRLNAIKMAGRKLNRVLVNLDLTGCWWGDDCFLCACKARAAPRGALTLGRGQPTLPPASSAAGWRSRPSMRGRWGSQATSVLLRVTRRTSRGTR